MARKTQRQLNVVEPRPSASVILVRDGPGGLEVFMVRRHAQSAVAPSAYVFPGGTVRSDDLRFQPPPDHAALASELAARSDTPVEPPQATAYYVSALRELFEEAGVLLARDQRGRVLEVDDADQTLQERLASARLALQARELSLADLLGERDWRPAFDLLVPFSHWVTPALLAARFDTRFFVAEMPPRQMALHCTIETSEGLWLTPAALLDDSYHVVYATAQHLRRLAQFRSVRDLLGFACEKPIRRLSPEIVESGSGLQAFIPPGLEDAW